MVTDEQLNQIIEVLWALQKRISTNDGQRYVIGGMLDALEESRGEEQRTDQNKLERRLNE